MSASLVGSEMCIRDSLLRMCSLRSGPEVTRNQHMQRSYTMLTTRSSRTVSYTHLTLPTICSV
eukprot:3140724-Alexandrium_andersonii.AAC.1